jgi:mono/diheme cytochrome c family protein
MRLLIYISCILFLYACSDAELSSMQQKHTGAKLYELHCSNCHQADGSGLAMLIPPLKQSDYLLKHAKNLPCMIRQGMQGEIQVNGKIYNQKMPANDKLNEQDVLAICLYVLQKFPENPVSLHSDSLIKSIQNCPSNSH